MKPVLSVLLIAVISAVAQLLMPWWVVAPVAVGVCYWRSRTAGSAFVEGALGVALPWVLYAGFLNYRNGGILAARLGELLFNVPNSAGLMAGVTTLVGSLVGGLAGLAGYYVRQATRAVQPSVR